MSFEFDEEEFERDVKIKVVGVGGGGGNAVENMVRNNVEGVDFIIVNTDVAALKAKDGSAMERVQIGRKTTKGRGAGGKPPVAAESAKENSDDIEEALAAYPSQQIRVVYQTGGSSYWYQDISDDRLERFVLENGELQKVDERPNANMGDAGTLSEFLIWGVQHYPAERMGVIL